MARSTDNFGVYCCLSNNISSLLLLNIRSGIVSPLNRVGADDDGKRHATRLVSEYLFTIFFFSRTLTTSNIILRGCIFLVLFFLLFVHVRSIPSNINQKSPRMLVSHCCVFGSRFFFFSTLFLTKPRRLENMIFTRRLIKENQPHVGGGDTRGLPSIFVHPITRRIVSFA